MNQTEPFARVAELDPYPAHAIRDMTVADAEADLLAQIVGEPVERSSGRRVAHRRPRRVAIAFGAVAASVAVAAISLTNVPGGPQSAWGAEARAFADRAQHMLLEGWSVTRTDEYGDEGEMTFTRGSQTADLYWRSGTVRDLVTDRAVSSDLRLTTHAADQEITILRAAPIDPHATPPGAPLAARSAPTVTGPATAAGLREYTAIWRAPGATLELRSEAPDTPSFQATLAAVRQVPVDRWLAAMPASVVVPGQRARTVDAMLRDLPIPPGLDVSGLRQGLSVTDRYQLGAHVAGTVACGWFDRWRAADASGDSATAQAALAAIQGTRRWSVLREMTAGGDYPKMVWQLADVAAGTATPAAGRKMSREEALSPMMVRNALGCGR